ncbi:MAG: hypothetical protein ACRECR_03295 [Thermoplasmata archaeon]
MMLLATASILSFGFAAQYWYIVGLYFIERYAVFALTMASSVGAALLLALRTGAAFKAGVVGAGAAIAIILGATLTYNLIGIDSASGFAAYLFGLSYVGLGNSYGPHTVSLYDLILGFFIAISATGLVTLDWLRADELAAPRRPGNRSRS